MNRFKSFYNRPFKDSHSHPCFPIIASNDLECYREPVYVYPFFTNVETFNHMFFSTIGLQLWPKVKSKIPFFLHKHVKKIPFLSSHVKIDLYGKGRIHFWWLVKSHPSAWFWLIASKFWEPHSCPSSDLTIEHYHGLAQIVKISQHLIMNNDTFLLPANEAWGKVMFLHLCIILFTGGKSVYGGSASRGGLPVGWVCIQGG